MGEDAILEWRARALAATPPRPNEGATLDMLIVRLGEVQYALDMPALHSVQRADNLTRVPNVPAFIAGVLNVRGEVVAVLNLAAALGLPGSDRDGSAADGTAQVVLVEASQGRVGLLVDEVLRVQTVALDELDRTFSGSDFARGIAEGRFVPLDLDQLLTDERFSIFDEVN
jgi:purine-binding chemotaxis protein CheW